MCQYSPDFQESAQLPCSKVCVCVCVYVCMYVFMYVCVCVCVCVYVHIYVYVYVHTYAYIMCSGLAGGRRRRHGHEGVTKGHVSVLP